MKQRRFAKAMHANLVSHSFLSRQTLVQEEAWLDTVSGKHFPGPDFPLWKWEKLTYSIVFAKFLGQHFPLCIFMKKGKGNLVTYYLNKTLV